MFLSRLILFLPIALVVLLTNFFVDPANLLLRDRTEKYFATVFAQGKNIANVADQIGYNDRLLQIYYAREINKQGKKISIMAIGSSRGMNINMGNPAGGIFYNASVYGAGVIDQINLYNIFKYYGQIPKKLVVALDPISPSSGLASTITTWKMISRRDLSDPGVNKIIDVNFLEEEGVLDYKSVIDRYYKMVSPSYFQTSFFSLVKKLTGKDYYVTDRIITSTRMKLSNGSLRYPDEVEAGPTAVSYGDIDNLVYKNTDDTEPTPLMKEKIETWINQMIKDKVEVIFFLPPINPRAYSVSNVNYFGANIGKSENYFRELAGKYNIKVYGSYDPSRNNLNQNDFTDLIHPKTRVVRQIYGE